jgi:hypothetical protein
MAANEPGSGSSRPPASTRATSAGGLSSTHPPVPELPAAVAPTTAKQSNLINLPLIPIACWKLEDIRFDFGSSFPRPNMVEELKHLAALIDVHRGAPLSVFGHADPTGDDAFNKQLSGRRAAVIYGLLIRKLAIWKDVAGNTGTFANPNPEDRWGTRADQVMLDATGFPPDRTDGKASAGTAAATKRFQSAHGLPPSGKIDAATRDKLFLAYMDALCGSLQLEPKDFLAQGADPHGKGDFQGCGEFNPILIFSDRDNKRFARETDKSERDQENGPNRRVMVLLFRPGTAVLSSRWPCPRAKEGITGCVKRFWSDGESRRSRRLPEEPRKFEVQNDTFACRFYHRLVSGSPCERLHHSISVRWVTDGSFEKQVSLHVADSEGKELRQLSASASSEDPKGTHVFDLEVLDPIADLRVRLSAGTVKDAAAEAVKDIVASSGLGFLDQVQKLFVGKVSVGLLAGDRDIALSGLKPAKPAAKLNEPSPSGDVSTAGYEYRELSQLFVKPKS